MDAKPEQLSWFYFFYYQHVWISFILLIKIGRVLFALCGLILQQYALHAQQSH